MRGGSFWNDADRTRAAYRNIRNPGNEIRNQGFRVLLPGAPSSRQNAIPAPSRSAPGGGLRPVRSRPPVPVAPEQRIALGRPSGWALS